MVIFHCYVSSPEGSYGKLPFLMGKSTLNGHFNHSFWYVYWRVVETCGKPSKNQGLHCLHRAFVATRIMLIKTANISLAKWFPMDGSAFEAWTKVKMHILRHERCTRILEWPMDRSGSTGTGIGFKSKTFPENVWVTTDFGCEKKPQKSRFEKRWFPVTPDDRRTSSSCMRARQSQRRSPRQCSRSKNFKKVYPKHCFPQDDQRRNLGEKKHLITL